APRRFTWASERSRWNGVGSTLSIGKAAITCQWPPSGSRKRARTDPPSFSIVSARSSRGAGGEPSETSRAERPREPFSAAFRLFFFGGMVRILSDVGGRWRLLLGCRRCLFWGRRLGRSPGREEERGERR